MSSFKQLAETVAKEYAHEAKQWWWLSFADGRFPKGSQFLGSAIVPGTSIFVAASVAREARINPGGEVLGLPIPAEVLVMIDDKHRFKLLSRAESEAVDEEVCDRLARLQTVKGQA